MEKNYYENDYIIGKYGHLRLEYLKNHKKAKYIIMFMNCNLRKHIVDTNLYLKFCLTFTNICFRIYIKFVKIGSDFYL